MKNSKITLMVYSVAVSLLAVPLIAMQFSDQVKWSAFDFAVAGVLLFTTATMITLILKYVTKASSKFIYVSVAIIVLFLIWAELAVGIFGTPFAGN